jgi:hypothetical protein
VVNGAWSDWMRVNASHQILDEAVVTFVIP